jgi:hypothetical protein
MSNFFSFFFSLTMKSICISSILNCTLLAISQNFKGFTRRVSDVLRYNPGSDSRLFSTRVCADGTQGLIQIVATGQGGFGGPAAGAVLPHLLRG